MVSDRSNGIYRGVVAAIVGLILAGASPPAKEEKQTAATNKQEPAKPTTTISDEYKPYPNKYADSCYRANNHDSADLCAQWRSAIAAEKAADATIWGNSISTAGALLSFVSIILVLIALGQTRKANRLTMKANVRATRQAVASAADTAKALEIAERNANTAIKQVKVSEMTAKRQLRAYVDTDIGSIGIDDSGRLLIDLQIRNFGKTPAKKVQSVIQSYIGKHPLESELPALIGKVEKSSVSIGQGSFVEFLHTHDSPLTGKDVEKIVKEELAIYVYGKITYSDIFGDKQTAKYCMFCTGGEGAELGRFAGYHTGNEST